MHVTVQKLNIGLMFAAIFSMAALMQTAAQAGAESTMWMWQLPMDKAWGYDISWYQDPNKIWVEGSLTPQIVVESVTDGTVKGRMATISGETLPFYDEDSRVIATFGYDSGASSPHFVFIPDKGEFLVEIPEEYSDADYMKLWINSHRFNVIPSNIESGILTKTTGPIIQNLTSTLITAEGLEETTEREVTEESVTTTEVIASETTIVRITTVKDLITEKTTVTTPKSTNQVNTAEEETTSESSTTSNTTSTKSASADGRFTTVKDVIISVSSDMQATSDDDSVVKITTVVTNNTSMTTETISLALEAAGFTVWDNHKHFKIDGYYLFDGIVQNHTYYLPNIPVAVDSTMIEYRLGA